MFWGEPFLFFNILLLRSFQTSQVRKPRTKSEALFIISLPEKFFLHFFKVLVMLPMSLSVCLNIGATQFHKVEVNWQMLSR